MYNLRCLGHRHDVLHQSRILDQVLELGSMLHFRTLQVLTKSQYEPQPPTPATTLNQTLNSKPKPKNLNHPKPYTVNGGSGPDLLHETKKVSGALAREPSLEHPLEAGRIHLGGTIGHTISNLFYFLFSKLVLFLYF